MSNSAGSPSTLRPAIYGAAQKLHCKRNINTASDNKYYALLMPYIPVAIKETKKKKDWNDGKIPKKGNLKQCDNWRGICVLPAITKTIAKFILSSSSRL